jgi:hypothetical protein
MPVPFSHDGTGTTSYTYNSVWASGAAITGGGRIDTITGPLGSTAAITYGYDALGRTTGTSINSVSSSVTFDSLGRVTGASNPLGSFTYAYYGVTPRLETLTYPNGQSTSYSYQTGSTQDYRLTDITNYLTGTTVLSKFDYTYNPVGTIATEQEQTDSSTPTLWAYGYDNADQLLSATQTNTSTSAVLAQYVYGYDLAGNRLTEQIGLRGKGDRQACLYPRRTATGPAAATGDQLPARCARPDNEVVRATRKRHRREGGTRPLATATL